MATIVTAIDAVTAWVEKNVCSRVKLKKPPANENEANDAGYDYELVEPSAHAMYVPTQDKAAIADKLPIPSVCVRVTDGSCDYAGGECTIDFELIFATWDGGTHGRDMFDPVGNNIFVQRSGAAAKTFDRNGGGWRDAWNLIDTALRELGRTTLIADLTVDKTVPVKFSPLKEQNSIPDFYPYWFSVLTFTVKQSIRTQNAYFDDEILKHL